MRHRRPQPRAPSHATQPRRIRPPDRTRRPPAHLTHLTAITSALRLRSPKNGSAKAHLPNPTVRVCEPYTSRALAAPLHLHTREDEYSFVLQGRMGALLGDDVVEAGPSDLVFKPRNQWHTFWNAGDEPCRILEIISPAGFERFFQELVDMGGVTQADPETFAQLRQRYGLEMQPETVPELLEGFGLRMGEPLSGGWMP